MIATRHHPLIAAILASPDDDGPRFAYADWLEENDRDECGWCRGRGFADVATGWCDPCQGSGSIVNDNVNRAEFIRVQCEIATLLPRLVKEYNSRDGMSQAEGWHLHALHRRERELWGQIGVGLFNDLGIVWPGTTTKHSLTTKTGFALVRIAGGADRAVWSRGFLSGVTTTTVGFMGGLCVWCGGSGGASNILKCPYGCVGGRALGLAPAIFARQPVTAVTLSDAEPWADDLNDEVATYRWQWDRREQNEWDGQGTPPWSMGDLPEQLFKRIKRDPHHRRVDLRTGRMARIAMKTFDTESDAIAALSDACVRWGREQARENVL